MEYVVPNMRLIPQDKTMSCWFASAQMLIQWLWRTKLACDAGHPDPSLLKKWGKLYDDNPGITNAQLSDFARDLGLAMLPPMTPSPDYIKQLLVRHGPLWINGNSHITVVAGIRSKGAGYEVLVYDHDKLVARHTSLDASAASKTSMLYIND